MSANFGVVRTDPVCREACPFCEPIAEHESRVFRVQPCDEHEDAFYEALARQRAVGKLRVPNVDRPWSPYDGATSRIEEPCATVST